MSNLYQEHILDHYSNPRNRRVIEKPDVYFRDNNPLCGDEIAIYASVKKGAIADASFIARGCAISQAAASMLTDAVKNKKLSEVAVMDSKDVIGMLMIPISHTRMKCAVLALKSLQAGIALYEAKKNAKKSA